MAIAIAIPFPRLADHPSGERLRRIAPVVAQPGAGVYSPYGRRRLRQPMVVALTRPSDGAPSIPMGTAVRSRLPFFFRARRG